ncbi:MAG: hypothetical protein ACFB8W_12735 [Elainellaceae cyanobacterium]
MVVEPRERRSPLFWLVENSPAIRKPDQEIARSWLDTALRAKV